MKRIPETLKKFVQVLPKEILDELKEAASLKKRNLDEEVAIRLYATIKAPEAFKINDLLTKILNYKFSNKQIKKELEYREQCKRYQYEWEKMEFMIRHESFAPHSFSDEFLFISMEVEGKIIRESLKLEETKNK